MGTNNTIIVITFVVAIVIIIGFIIFRRKAKVGIDIHGNKLDFEGSNEVSSREKNPKAHSNGIFHNILIGKSNIKVKGKGIIADNIGIGDTKIGKDDVEPPMKYDSKKR